MALLFPAVDFVLLALSFKRSALSVSWVVKLCSLLLPNSNTEKEPQQLKKVISKFSNIVAEAGCKVKAV